MMTPDLLQFVNAISSTPTVLLDLNNGSPIYLAENGWSAPPPRLNRASSSSTSRDGTNVSQSAYADRELVIRLGLDTVSQDEAAEAIQALARLLNSDGQWLKYQTAIAPVFFRTKRAEIDALDEFNGQADGFREVTIRIPAEPFAYGLPVSGTATINNDATAATNPLGFTFPTIVGDVESPLRLNMTTTGFAKRLTIASMARNPLPPKFPVLVNFSAPAASDTGWTGSTLSGAGLYFGGTAAQQSRASGALSQLVATASTAANAVVPGEYRALVRADVPAGWTLSTVNPPNADVSAVGSYTSSGAGMFWRDLGVVTSPSFAPIDSSMFDGSPAGITRTLGITATSSGGTGAVVVDAAVLIPIGLPGTTNSDFALFQSALPLLPGYTFRLDGQMGDASIRKVSNPDETYTTKVTTTNFMSVTPGVPNALVVIDGNADFPNSVTVNWSYYPRYLYIRPATT